MQTKEYIKFISEIKENIIKSRYKAASLANKEMLLLYYYTGYKLSQKIKSSKWGNGVVSNISKDLQKELPGLRGFSFRNLQNMKQFYEEYELLQNLLLPSQDQSFIIMQSSTAQLKENEFMQLMTAQINDEDNDLKIETFIENSFLKIGFTHHITLINKCKDINERVFYFQKTIENQWSITILEHHINSKLFQLTGKIINNFDRTLPVRLHKHATNAFKSEYLLDFINLDEDDDERVLENEIVKNIKKFILSLGNDFSFIGNQYRVTVGEEEFFIDLLFFHRTLQSLIAFELKRGKFKAEYAGKMNLYLSALDEYVKKEHENPSIGIILCKEKDDKVIEFAFRDYNKAMGVAKLKTSREIPDKFKGLLPDIEELKKLI
jgi:predicted nuclease of restriction endonuclease-like (RecB) superfamily